MNSTGRVHGRVRTDRRADLLAGDGAPTAAPRNSMRTPGACSLGGLRLRIASPSTGPTIGILAKGVDGEESRQQKRQEIFHISSIKVSVLNAASALKGSL